MMMETYTDFEKNTIVEINNWDKDDLFTFGPNYFGCGWKEESYYNFNFAIAVALIGKNYGDMDSKNSDYHKGINYIASEVGVSKRQVKTMRKRIKYKKGYWFKTPYAIVEIIAFMIEKLKACKDEEYVNLFLSKHEGDLYREMLIAEQYISIKLACNGKRTKVVNIADKLTNITDKVGR